MDVLTFDNIEGNKENVKLSTKILLQRRFSMRENRKGQALVDVNSNIEKVGGLCSGLKKSSIEDKLTTLESSIRKKVNLSVVSSDFFVNI